MILVILYVGLKFDLDRITTHPKFNPTRVQTYDIQIMETTFHVPETLALTTEPSEPAWRF